MGEKEFGLSNTNKLLKMVTNFEVTGLKTGSTSLAKYLPVQQPGGKMALI